MVDPVSFKGVADMANKNGRVIAGLVAFVVVFIAVVLAWLLLSNRKPLSESATVLASPVTPTNSNEVAVQYDQFHDETNVSAGYIYGDENAKADATPVWALMDADGAGGFIQKKGVYLAIAYRFHGKTISTLNGGISFNFSGSGVSESDPVAFLLDGTQHLSNVSALGRTRGWTQRRLHQTE